MMSRTWTKYIWQSISHLSGWVWEAPPRSCETAGTCPAIPPPCKNHQQCWFFFIIALLVCFKYLIPWQEVAHNICHAPFLHFFDDSAIAAMVHHLGGNRLLPKNARLSEQTTNNHPDVQCSQCNAMQCNAILWRKRFVGSPSHRLSWGQAELQRKWSTSLPCAKTQSLWMR